MLKERKSLCQLIEVTDKQLHEMNYSQAVIYSYRNPCVNILCEVLPIFCVNSTLIA